MILEDHEKNNYGEYWLIYLCLFSYDLLCICLRE